MPIHIYVICIIGSPYFEGSKFQHSSVAARLTSLGIEPPSRVQLAEAALQRQLEVVPCVPWQGLQSSPSVSIHMIHIHMIHIYIYIHINYIEREREKWTHLYT